MHKYFIYSITLLTASFYAYGANNHPSLITPDQTAYNTKSSHISSSSTNDSSKKDYANLAAHSLEEHTDTIMSVKFSPDGKHLVSGGLDRQIIMWNLQEKVPQVTLKCNPKDGPVNCITCSPDSSVFACGTQDGIIHFIDSLSGAGLCSDYPFDTGANKCYALHKIQFHPKQYALAAAFASIKNSIALYGLDQKACIGEYTTSPYHEAHSLAINSRGSLLAVGGVYLDGKIYLFDVGTMNQIGTLKGHSKNNINDLEFNKDGTLLASACDDRTARVWDLSNRKCLHTLKGHSDGVSCITFNPKKPHAITTSYDRTIRIWHTKTGNCLYVLPYDPISEDMPMSISCHPDGTMFATCSGNRLLLFTPEVYEKYAIKKDDESTE